MTATKPATIKGIEALPSGSYRATVSIPGGGRTRRTFATQDEAVAWKSAERVVTLAGVRGRGVKPVAPGEVGGVKFGAYFDRWLASTKLARSSRSMYSSHYRNHVAAVLGNVPVAQIGPRLLDQLAVELADKGTLAEATQARIFTIVAAVLAGAVEDDLIEVNPATRMRQRPTAPDVTMRVMSEAELAAVLEASDEPWRTLWLVCGQTAVRISEALGIQVGSVNLEARTIRIKQQLDRDTHELAPTKPKLHRTVGLTTRAVEALRPLVEGRKATALVFTAANGGPVHYYNLKDRVWRETMAELGWLEADDCPTIHTLRHTAVSHMLDRGANPTDVQAVAGHGSFATTQKYIHQRGDHSVRAASVLE